MACKIININHSVVLHVCPYNVIHSVVQENAFLNFSELLTLSFCSRNKICSNHFSEVTRNQFVLYINRIF